MAAGAACGSGGGFPDAREIDAAPPQGAFSLDWTVSDVNSATVTCDQVGAQSVTVLAHNQAVEGGLTQVFVCSTLTGTSQGLDPGTYDFDFQLVGSSGTLSTVPGQHNVTIASNETTHLMPLAFQLDATGNLALNLSTGRAANCGTTPSAANAGITAETLTLTHNSDGSCEPITLTVGASAIAMTMPSTYVINCTTPVVTTCFEKDASLTATGVKADGYTIHIVGKQGANVCWLNSDSIVVPPLGGTLTRQLNLGFQTATSSCM